MEEDNISEHRNYLVVEEEKRHRAKPNRIALDGPFVRWVSRTEQAPLQIDQSREASLASEDVSKFGWAYTGWAATATPTVMSHPFAVWPPTDHPRSLQDLHVIPASATLPDLIDHDLPLASVESTPKPNSCTENVMRNYVVHELGQTDGANKPSWKETMCALFGDHICWEDLDVYIGKGQPHSECLFILLLVICLS
jgi:hypothetical protein